MQITLLHATRQTPHVASIAHGASGACPVLVGENPMCALRFKIVGMLVQDLWSCGLPPAVPANIGPRPLAWGGKMLMRIKVDLS